MAVVSVDTNVLVRAVDTSAGIRHELAKDVVRRAGERDGVLTQQVIGEFLNVSCKSAHMNQPRLRRIAVGLCGVFPILPTKRESLFDAYDLAERYRLQFWDAVILSVCRANDVTTLLTEDMQDGQTIGDVLILNPLRPENADRIDRLLPR